MSLTEFPYKSGACVSTSVLSLGEYLWFQIILLFIGITEALLIHQIISLLRQKDIITCWRSMVPAIYL